METIQFQFSGGMADNHEMNFYEAGRFQYGAARFIYTLEKFRQEGKVVSRLTNKINADIRIKAPTQGSFIQDVLVFALPILAECSIQCSFEAMFAYAWNLLRPPSKATDIAVEIAKSEVQKEKERTKQEAEKTAQFQAMADVVSTMAEVAKEGYATNRQALDILQHAVDQNLTLASEEYRLGREDIKAIREEAIANQEREQLLKDNEECFKQIKPETEKAIAAQLRKSVKDLALPLRSSATELNIRTSDSTTKKVAFLNKASAEAIGNEEEDDHTIIIRGTIKSYDVETGYGKFRYDELNRPIPFRVPSASREFLKEIILDAMKKDDVLIRAYFVRDSFNNPVSIVLDEILKNENLDDLGRTG